MEVVNSMIRMRGKVPFTLMMTPSLKLRIMEKVIFHHLSPSSWESFRILLVREDLKEQRTKRECQREHMEKINLRI
jgi:hypothetical protein